MENVKFKMIPWGIDQTLQPTRHFKLDTSGLIAKLVRNDTARRAQVIDQIRTYRDTVFSRETQETVLKPMIEKMEALLTGFGVPNASAELATVRKQLRLAGSAGYLCAGLPDADGAYIRFSAVSSGLGRLGLVRSYAAARAYAGAGSATVGRGSLAAVR